MRSSNVASGLGSIVVENAVRFQAARPAKPLKAAWRHVDWTMLTG
jgi:hypothetical protein